MSLLVIAWEILGGGEFQRDVDFRAEGATSAHDDQLPHLTCAARIPQVARGMLYPVHPWADDTERNL
ncbi:hypothetical protein B5P44_14125 [Mycobacterium sp. CBMA 213]|nr:hypothetical protein [Mycolicibacterium sp. CBMA 213]